MSSSTLPPTTLDAKYVGTFGSLAALIGVVAAPVIGDTATLTDSAGATGGGVAGVKRKVYWSGGSWVVFDTRQNTSTNSTTVISDASRAPIINSSPSEDNLAGITEYRSSQSVNFSVQDGIVQANAVLAGMSIRHTGVGAPSIPFATLTFISADAVGYNTLNATTTFSPLGISLPITSRYEIIANWWSINALTTTSDGFVYVGRAQNGGALAGGAGQTNSIPVGTVFPTRSPAAPHTNVNSVAFTAPLSAGTIVNTVAYQNILATYIYAGNTTAGIRQE